VFITIPVAGPPTLHEQCIRDKAMLSDMLGGAMPVTIANDNSPVAVHLRDDCLTGGWSRNRLAGLLMFSLTRTPLPILGPVVLTVVVPNPGDPHRGRCECLPEVPALALMDLAGDLLAALQNRDHLITPRHGMVLAPDEWAVQVRETARRLDGVALPASYPYPPEPARDRVAEGLAAAGLHVSGDIRLDLPRSE
jgi:hypothetical protein